METETATVMNNIALPFEMIEEIMSSLNVRDLKTCRLVSSDFEIIANRILKNLTKLCINSFNINHVTDLTKLDKSPFLQTFLISNSIIKMDIHGYSDELSNIQIIQLIHRQCKANLFKYLELNSDNVTSWIKLNLFHFIRLLELRINISSHISELPKPLLRLKKLSLICKNYGTPDYYLTLIENILRNSPRLSHMIFEGVFSGTNHNFLPLFTIVSVFSHIKTIFVKLKFVNFNAWTRRGVGSLVEFEIFSSKNFENLEIKVEDVFTIAQSMRGGFIQTKQEIYRNIINFIFSCTEFIKKLNLTLTCAHYDEMERKKIDWNETEFPPLPCLSKCKELTLKISKFKTSPKFIPTSSFPVLEKIIFNTPSSLLPSAECIKSIITLEISDGFLVKTTKFKDVKNWASAFPNCRHLSVKNPSVVLVEGVVSHMKKLVFLKLSQVNVNLWQCFTGKPIHIPHYNITPVPKSSVTIRREKNSLESFNHLRTVEIDIGKFGGSETIDALIYLTLKRKIQPLEILRIDHGLNNYLAFGAKEPQKTTYFKHMSSYHKNFFVKLKT